ncbi:glycosyltransferase family 4 protein [Aequorivita capsosiphonis]|uniref:glycosyltransferase family 4 protein n=1 Tax=Aequorivita capsosiphonis TaxID=487317 RepID=UPI00042446A4|nr:glycosyltransferase family 4 protein [Aequorivita capsosiphonis]
MNLLKEINKKFIKERERERERERENLFENTNYYIKIMKSIVIHAWTLHKKGDKYFIPYTHWVYLNEIVKYYSKVCLLSPINLIKSGNSSLETISNYKNVEVYELPYSDGYIDAIKYFFHYKKAYKELANNYDVVYARYPIPFGWLQSFYFKDKKKIIHFVGDPVDTIKNNPNLSLIKKLLYTKLFMPEHYMFMRACKTAKVYTNGFHISERLKKYNVNSTPLISSTLNDSDFYFEHNKVIDIEAPKIIYVGYLRKAKGVETVIRAFSLLQKEKPNAVLTIVGHGESEGELKQLATRLNLKNIVFLGHIESRDKLNELFRGHDIFCFASLSEGSPRVILEAMANGLAVISTPVGSLPSTFEDRKNILFSDFNDDKDFAKKLKELSSNNETYNHIRANSYSRVTNFKIENFLRNIFYEA